MAEVSPLGGLVVNQPINESTTLMTALNTNQAKGKATTITTIHMRHERTDTERV